MKLDLYCYKINRVIKVVDGDTLDLEIDLGFDVSINQRVRLYAINAPESRTRNREEKKRGLAAKARLKELCEEGGLLLKSYGKGKYGRILGELYVDGCNINNILISEGHAVEYYGGKR